MYLFRAEHVQCVHSNKGLKYNPKNTLLGVSPPKRPEYNLIKDCSLIPIRSLLFFPHTHSSGSGTKKITESTAFICPKDSLRS